MGQKGRHYIPAITGEYSTESRILSRAQEYFLVVAQSVAPGPLYALRDEVLPKYRVAFAIEKGRGKSDRELQDLSIQSLIQVVLGDEREGLKSLPEFQAAMEKVRHLYDATAELISWSWRSNLRGQRSKIDQVVDPRAPLPYPRDLIWPLVVGLETIFHWHFAPAGWFWERRTPPRWRPPVAPFKYVPKPPEILPPIQLKSFFYRAPQSQEQNPPETSGVEALEWWMEVETEGQFRRRMQKNFARWLDIHVDERKDAARSAGLIKVPAKRDRIHFVWAAKYQIRGASVANIARESQVSGAHVTHAAVEDAVKRVLNLIRLERRPGGRGPRPGGAVPRTR